MDREFYDKNGFALVKSVFSHAECDALVEAALPLADANFRPVMMPHRMDDAFLAALRHKKLVALMREAVGGTPAGLQTQWFFCRPGTHGFSRHQDNFFVEAADGVFASVWCPMVDTMPENGGLIVYPGSHKLGMLPVRKLPPEALAGQDPNARNEESVVPEGMEPVSVSVPKGAALLIHGELVHASHTNHSDRFRYVLLNTYIREGEAFRPGNHAKRAMVTL